MLATLCIQLLCAKVERSLHRPSSSYLRPDLASHRAGHVSSQIVSLSMASNESTGQRLGIFHDTGAPEGSADYTTLVILHGYVWHSGAYTYSPSPHRLNINISGQHVSAVFTMLLPLAKEHNTRIVLVNRRGYPGSAPYTDEELASFPAPLPENVLQQNLDDAREKLDVWLRDRTFEILHFLEDLVKADAIPPAQPERNAGGIVVVGWSFAALMAASILSYGPTFPASSDVDLGKYLRRVVMDGECPLALTLFTPPPINSLRTNGVSQIPASES